MMQVLQ